LLRDSDWKTHIAEHVRLLKETSPAKAGVMPFLWEVAQSLLPDVSQSTRRERMEAMLQIFGQSEGRHVTGLTFAGAIVFLDCSGVTFGRCQFVNCEWINCAGDSTTEFRDCDFRGRFHHVTSGGLGRAIFNPLTESNTDNVSLEDIDRLIGRRPRTNRDAATRLLKAFLNEFQRVGYSIPRGRRDVESMRLGQGAIVTSTIEALLARKVLEEDQGGRLRIAGRHGAAVMALLDNASLRGPLREVVDDVVNEFADPEVR
jgi:hypothetical protein